MKVKVNDNFSRHFLVYLGDELNRTCVGNGTGAESENFAFNFVKILI